MRADPSSPNHDSVENGSLQYDWFLWFRVIFHWTHDYGRKAVCFFCWIALYQIKPFMKKNVTIRPLVDTRKKYIPSFWALKNVSCIEWTAKNAHMRESCEAMNIKPIENLEKHPRPRTKPRWKTKKNQPQEPPTNRSWWRFWCWKVLMSYC